MRHLLALAISAVLVMSGSQARAAVQGAIPVGAPLILSAQNGKLVAVVRIASVPVGPGSALQSQWSEPGALAPRRQIGRLRIKVSGRDLILPLSAMMDLFEADTARLKPDRSGFVLEVRGGDGHLSYMARIRFDANRVLERRINGGEGGELWEQTTYSDAPFPYE